MPDGPGTRGAEFSAAGVTAGSRERPGPAGRSATLLLGRRNRAGIIDPRKVLTCPPQPYTAPRAREAIPPPKERADEKSARIVRVLAVAPVSHAADIEAGKAKVATVCAACHGANGVSVSDAIPNLAAQRAAYLEAQLKALKDGTRKNPRDERDRGAAERRRTSPTSLPTSRRCPVPRRAPKSALPAEPRQDQRDASPRATRTRSPSTTRSISRRPSRCATTTPTRRRCRRRRTGKPLPDGSVLFAEVYAAKLDADKKPVTGGDGFFVADKLIFYTAMARDAGWGKDIPEMLRNENWNYAVFTARQAAPARRQPGRVPRLPQAARQGELHLHAEAARRSEVGSGGAGCPPARRQPETGKEDVMAKSGRLGILARAAGVAALIAAVAPQAGAQQPGSRDRHRRHRRRRHRAERAGGRRLGDRRDARSAGPLHQDRRHRRSGRYVVPDLPKANYTVWVRGYGLVDSPEGRRRARASVVNLTAARSRRTRPPPRTTIRRSTGTRC